MFVCCCCVVVVFLTNLQHLQIVNFRPMFKVNNGLLFILFQILLLLNELSVYPFNTKPVCCRMLKMCMNISQAKKKK